MNNNDQAIKEKLEAYVAELDELVAKVKKSKFPFSDTLLVYEDVSKRLKSILEEK